MFNFIVGNANQVVIGCLEITGGKEVWTGLTYSAGQWAWDSGQEQLNYTNWAEKTESEAIEISGVAFMYLANDKWQVTTMESEIRGYVCKRLGRFR